jgi:penicillin-binding protein
MKKIVLAIFVLLIVLLGACSAKDEVTPNERFDTFVKQWNGLKFEKMYEMFASETKSKYPKKDSIDRYGKIYEDLNISDLKVNFKKLNEEELEKAMDSGVASIPFTVEMESLAGPITFDYKAPLIQEGEKDDKNWFVEWDPGFLFPEIKDGGEIKIKRETPKRGDILDRNQMPLAINDIVYEIGIVPEKLGDDEKKAKKKIADLLQISTEQIDSAIDADWVQPDLFVPLKKIPKTNDSLLDKLWKIDGVAGREVTGRIYPEDKAAAHLVGYVGQINAEELEKQEQGIYSANDMIGKRGLEQLYEKKLKGEPGAKIIVSKNDDEIVLAEKPVKNGKNITVTIDVNIQEKIYQSYDGDSGTAAAIDPKSGETLALVSSPSFDPNEILYGTTPNLWEKLQDDEKEPLLNRFKATFAPGSALKPITAAIGLENGTIKPNDGIEINGLTWSNGKGWGDYKVRRVSESSGPVDVSDALIQSDNIYFAMQAVKMGSDAFVSGMEQFGFGNKLPYEYPISASDVSSNGKIDDEVLLANSSYGQGQLEMSSLHLALAYTPFLNDGNMIKPTLLTSEKTGEIWQKDLITNENANIIKKALKDVVEKGTAKKAKQESLSISGKTGTAELKLTGGESGKENGWFVGYPSEDQDILIAMMIEGTEAKGGSAYTAKKVSDILVKLKK